MSWCQFLKCIKLHGWRKKTLKYGCPAREITHMTSTITNKNNSFEFKITNYWRNTSGKLCDFVYFSDNVVVAHFLWIYFKMWLFNSLWKSITYLWQNVKVKYNLRIKRGPQSQLETYLYSVHLRGPHICYHQFLLVNRI